VTRSRPSTASLPPGPLGDPGDGVGHGDGCLLAGRPVAHLDHALGQPAADDDDGRETQQFGVGELDSRRHVAVVPDDVEPKRRQLRGDALGLGRDRFALAGRHDRDVVGRHVARPGQAALVAGRLGHHGDSPRDADAVGAHPDGLELAILVEDAQVERLGVLLAQLEDVAHLDAARQFEGARAVGRRVAVAHLGRVDDAVAGEVAPADEVDEVVVWDVGARDPACAVDHARVEQVADLGGAVFAQDLDRAGFGQPDRADVALDQFGVSGEVGVAEVVDRGRVDGGLEPPRVDLAVARQADDERRLGAVRLGQRDDDVLEGVAAGPGPVGARHGVVGRVDQRRDRAGAGGVDVGGGGDARRVDRGRRRDMDGLDVGGVAAGRADVRVLAVLVRDEELLGARPAHGPGHGLDDDVLETEPVEDLDVRLAVLVVTDGEARLGQVERVGVLHDELLAAEDAGPRPGLVAVLDLDLVEDQRQVLVGGVEVFDEEREHLLVGRAEQEVGAGPVVEAEEIGAVLRPAVALLVGFPRQQGREADLLAADGVHFLADDLLDLGEDLQPERQPRVDPRRDAPDVAGADEPAVARHDRVGRVLPQGPDEQLRHAHDHGCLLGVGV
jgi:hypothetical protein